MKTSSYRSVFDRLRQRLSDEESASKPVGTAPLEAPDSEQVSELPRLRSTELTESVPDDYGVRLEAPILATKLHRPKMTSDLVRRDRLLEYLESNRHRPLTLISAPAGYGKTMLASSWIEESNSPCAWVSLDESDDNLETFMEYLIAAVNSIFPNRVVRSQTMLNAPLLPKSSVVTRILLTDLAEIDTPFFIVLDDLSVIKERRIFDVLLGYLRHPPQAVHLVLTSRADPQLPIASMRARGQLTEIRMAHLRFDVQEAAFLLSRMLDREVDETVAAQWVERTEGWVTALRLAALSLSHRGADDVPRLKFDGENRYLHDFLLAEVLSQLPQTTREQLLKISVVDRFTSSLCDVLCAGEDGSPAVGPTGESLTNWMEERNLFVIPLDDKHHWFRLHHLFQQLLQDHLRMRFDREAIHDLNLKASKWFAEHGLIEEALRYALAGGDTELALHLMIRHRHDLLNAKRWDRLERWIGMLPSDVAAQNPYSRITAVHLAIFYHSATDAEVSFALQGARQLLAGLPAEKDELRTLQGELLVLQAVFDVQLGKSERALANARQGLQMVADQAHMVQATAHAVIGLSMQMQGQFRQCTSMYEDLLQKPDLPSNLRADLLHHQCLARFQEGDLNGYLVLSHECLRISRENLLPWSTSHARHHLGIGHYLRNELAQAKVHLSALVEIRELSSPTYLTMGTIALALIHVSEGAVAEAEAVTDTVLEHLQESKATSGLAAMRAFKVDLMIRKGDVDGARALSEGVRFDARSPRWHFYVPQLTRIRLLLAGDTPDGQATARSELEALDEEMSRIHRNNVRIDVLALLALVCDSQGDTLSAFENLTKALLLARPGGHVRNFVDLGPPMGDMLSRLRSQNDMELEALQPYIVQVLDAFQLTRQDGVAPDVEYEPELESPLTKRELETLQYLATDLGQQEIANEMVVSIKTVYTHVRNIYRKLEVGSRSEAVHRAKDLDLL